MFVRNTVLPPEPDARRHRLAIVAGIMAVLVGGAYAVTRSVMWVFLVVVVGVPIVVLPCFLIVGIAIQMLKPRHMPKAPKAPKAP